MLEDSQMSVSLAESSSNLAKNCFSGLIMEALHDKRVVIPKRFRIIAYYCFLAYLCRLICWGKSGPYVFK